MNLLFTPGGQNIGASALASALPMNIQEIKEILISFRNDWFDLLAVQATLESLLQAELNIWNGAIQPVLMCALLVVDHKIQTFYPMVQLWLNIQVRPAHVQSIRLFVDLLYLWKR